MSTRNEGESHDTLPSLPQLKELLLERTADPILILDSVGRVLWVNEAARRLLDLTDEQLRTRPLITEIVDWHSGLGAVLTTSRDRSDVIFSVQDSGSRLYLSLETHVGPEGSPMFHSVIGRDLGGIDMARLDPDSEAERSRLFSLVAHEIRTPLTSILGLGHTLSERFEAAGDTEAAELAALIVEQADDLERIVKSMLSTSSRHAKPSIERIDLRTQAEAAIRSSGVAIEAVIEGDAIALGDPSRVRQILRNLLTNAHRYGAPPITVRIEHLHDSARISVIDHGPGVAAALESTLFDPFVTTGETSVGLGLGLMLAKALAQDLGGSLSYARIDDTTRFTLNLRSA